MFLYFKMLLYLGIFIKKAHKCLSGSFDYILDAAIFESTHYSNWGKREQADNVDSLERIFDLISTNFMTITFTRIRYLILRSNFIVYA